MRACEGGSVPLWLLCLAIVTVLACPGAGESPQLPTPLESRLDEAGAVVVGEVRVAPKDRGAAFVVSVEERLKGGMDEGTRIRVRSAVKVQVGDHLLVMLPRVQGDDGPVLATNVINLDTLEDFRPGSGLGVVRAARLLQALASETENATAVWVGAIHDNDATVRLMFLDRVSGEGYYENAPPELVTKLVEARKSAARDLAGAALDAIGRHDPETITRGARALVALAPALRHGKTRDDVTDRATAMVDDGAEQFACSGVQILAALGDERVMSSWKRVMARARLVEVRASLLKALVALGQSVEYRRRLRDDEDVLGELVRALGDAAIRSAAVEALDLIVLDQPSGRRWSGRRPSDRDVAAAAEEWRAWWNARMASQRGEGR